MSGARLRALFYLEKLPMASQMPSRIGAYQIQKLLGEGAFGRVYQAYDARVNRPVAIKVLLLTDKEIVTRFRNEAIVAGNLNHNNIVTIFEFGEHEGLPFLAMQFLDGENLQDVIRSKKPLTMLQKISIMTQIAEGLDCAHRHGVVHRDVKPANMMLLPDGTVKIMDFGIARLTGGRQSSRLTQQGNVLGTLLYMAPEQFTANTEVDALCDIFACGEVYYELLTGRHPFEANEPRQLIYKVTVEDPPPLRKSMQDCPAGLEDVLARMLSKHRELRYQSLREVLFDIQPVLMDLQQERAAALMTQAQDLFQRQQTEAANALMPEILELDPGNRTAYRLRDQIQRQLLKPKIAAFLKTGREEMAKRRYHEAIQAFAAAARLDSTNTEIQDLLGQARTAQEQSQRAARLVTEARQALDQQNLAAAYKSASEALACDPENAHASRLLLVIRSAIDRKRQQQQLEESLLKAEHLLMIQAYDAALEALAGMDAGDKRVEEMAARIRARKLEHDRTARLAAGMATATEMLREQKLAETVDHLTALAGEFPDNSDVRQLLEYARKELAARQRAQAIARIKADAQKLVDAHDFGGALELLDNALEKYEDGSLVRVLGSVMAAKAAWERQQAVQAACAKCEQLRAEGKLPDAIRAAESALRIYNADPSLQQLLRDLEHDWEQQKRADEIRAAVAQARGFLETGRPEIAVRFLPEAARRFPESAEIQELLAQAQAACQAQLRQREVETLDRQARSFAERADYEAALQVLSSGLQKFPDEPRLAELRGEIAAKNAALLRSQEVQRTIQDCDRLSVEGRFSEALELVNTLLHRYEGEPALLQAQQRLEADWEQRRRKLAIIEAVTQARGLMAQGKSAEAVQVLEVTHQRYPDVRELESMLARAQRAAALEQFVHEVRALLENGGFEEALKRIGQGLRTWPGERSLVALQEEASSGLAAVRRAQAIREAVESCRQLCAQGRPAEALRLADRCLRDYPGDAELLAARQESQARVEEEERIRKRAAEMQSLRHLESDAFSLTDAGPIRELAGSAKALAEAYADDEEIAQVSGRTLEVLKEAEQANALLVKRDFHALLAVCARVRSRYPEHPFFKRLEDEGIRAVRQQALQEIRERVQNENDLRKKSQLLDDALRQYRDEEWLQREAQFARGKLGLVNSIVEKARAAEKAEAWDEAIEQWNFLRGLYANYPGLDRELESLSQRKAQAFAQARESCLEQVRQLMASGDYGPARETLYRTGREFAGDSELEALRDQVEFAQQAVQEARAAAANQTFADARKILEAALSRYDGDVLLRHELESVARQVAERDAAIGEAVQQADELASQQRLEEAWKAAESALQRYGEDARLQDLRRRLEALRVREEHIHQAVRQARALTEQQKFDQATEVIETELGRYPGDPTLESEAEGIRQAAERQQALRLQALREAVRQIQSLLGQNRLEEARKLADTSLQRFPDDSTVAAASRQVQAKIEEDARKKKRAADLQMLQTLEQETRALTDSAHISGMVQKLHAVVAPYPDDAEFSQISTAIQQQLDDMQQACALLAGREYGSVLEICAGYPNHRLMRSLQEEAGRAVRISEAGRQIDEEPSLRRRAELVDAALQAFPGENSLLERSRAVRSKLDDVNATAENARRSESQERWDEALVFWNQVRTLDKDFPDLNREFARVEEGRKQAREAARVQLIGRIRQQLEIGDYAAADGLVETARQQFPGDAEVEDLSRRMQAVRDVVQQARALVADGELLHALEVIESALHRYQRDKLLEGELQAVRQEAARQAELRANAIQQAAAEIEALAGQGRCDEAIKLAKSSLHQFPGEERLLAAQEQARRAQQRSSDLEVLRRLEAEMCRLTEVAGIPGLEERVGRLAALYAGDAEISQVAANLEKELTDMAQARALLENRDFAAVFTACAEYPGRAFFARIKTEADDELRAARVAETHRQVEEEPDLMRQIELVESTIRSYPDEESLLRRARALRSKLDEVTAIVQKAGEAEKEERWDEALAHWRAVGEIYGDYPGLAGEIDRVATLKRRAIAVHREELGDQVWQSVNEGDNDAAAELLRNALDEFPQDTELQFLRERVESVRQTVREAAELIGTNKQNEAVRLLEAALSLYTGDKLLESELHAVHEQIAHQEQLRSSAIQQTIEQIEALTEQRRFTDALKLAESSLVQFRAEPRILAAQEQAKRVQRRCNDLDTLRRLEAEIAAATDVRLIENLQERVRTLAGSAGADNEISRAAADLDRVLADMQQANVLLDQQDFAGVLSLCGEYGEQPLFAGLRTEATRRQRAAYVAEVQRQVERQSDLRLQVELLRAALDLYPDEAQLLDRYRALSSKLTEVEGIVQKAREAEKTERWDAALAQWELAGRIYGSYPGLAQKIERIKTLKERDRAARAEQLVDKVWQLVNEGDYEGAAELLQLAETEFADNAELKFLREQVESVRQSVREARELASKGNFSDAGRLLRAALDRNPGDALLQQVLSEISQQI